MRHSSEHHSGSLVQQNAAMLQCTEPGTACGTAGVQRAPDGAGSAGGRGLHGTEHPAGDGAAGPEGGVAQMCR